MQKTQITRLRGRQLLASDAEDCQAKLLAMLIDANRWKLVDAFTPSDARAMKAFDRAIKLIERGKRLLLGEGPR